MTFTITSFNAHAGLRPRANGRCLPYDLVSVLEDLATDITVVQETWWPADGSPSAVRVAADRLGAHTHELPFGRAVIDPWPHVRRDGGGDGSIGLTVVTRVPARLVAPVPFGRVFNDHTPERSGLHLEVDVPGGPIDLVGVHLTSRLPYGPPIQLRRLRAQLPPAIRPTIVTGDCNFWGPGVMTFLPGWRRAVRGRTWPARMPHSQIDHILVRDGADARLRVVDAEVLPDVGSDHLPVRATLEVLQNGRMSNTVRGVIARAEGAPVEVTEIVVPEPGPGEARITVQACGVCHTDLHYREGAINDEFPFLLGHEAAGVVESVGPDVADVAAGDFVILNWRAVCGTCRACRRGRPWYCFATFNATQKMTLVDSTPLTPALGIGAFAEQTLVASGQATKVDARARPETAGLLGCGVMAGLGAAMFTGNVGRGDSVAVFGCGGVGNAAIAGAQLAGAHPIIGVDVDDRKLALAREFGATHTVNAATTDPVEAIRALTGTFGADVCIEAVGRPEVLEQAFYARDLAGTVVQVGVPDPSMTIELPMIEFFGRGGALKPSWYGDCLPSRDFPMLIDLYLEGRLDLDRFVSETIGLDDVEEAFHKMERGEVLRSVVLL